MLIILKFLLSNLLKKLPKNTIKNSGKLPESAFNPLLPAGFDEKNSL
jgi:hypothetical protein